MLQRACLNNMKSVLNPRPKCHRFLSQVIKNKKKPYPHIREIQFLNPENITYHKQSTIDLSGLQNPRFFFPSKGNNKTVRLNYYNRERKYQPFPENTRGHLYYCGTPPQDRPPLSGSVRFRILPSTSDHPKDFAEGIDLLRPNGQVWELPLYSVIREAGYAPLAQKLLDENLLDTDLLNSVSELPKTRLRRTCDCLYTLSDPFTWSLGQTKVITVITEDRLESFTFHPFHDRLCQTPFTGTVLARFEKSNLPEHVDKRGVVVRVLDILSPINCVIPDYDFNFKLPEAGQLIAKRRISGRHGKFRCDYYPWSLDISSSGILMAKHLALLFPEK